MALRNSLNARERLRERYFAPEEYEALFERESALDRGTLARLEIQHNTGLTERRKARALKDAEAELPPEQRADRAHAVAHLAPAAQTQDFETPAWTIAPATSCAAPYGNRRRLRPWRAAAPRRARLEPAPGRLRRCHGPGP